MDSQLFVSWLQKILLGRQKDVVINQKHVKCAQNCLLEANGSTGNELFSDKKLQPFFLFLILVSQRTTGVRLRSFACSWGNENICPALQLNRKWEMLNFVLPLLIKQEETTTHKFLFCVACLDLHVCFTFCFFHIGHLIFFVSFLYRFETGGPTRY